MMRDGHIDKRGWVALVTLFMTGKIFNPSAAILNSYGERATWLLSLLAGLMSFLFLLLALHFMKKFPGLGILDVVEKRTGRWASKIYGCIILVALLMDGGFSLRLLVDQTKVVTLPNTPISFMTFCILLLAIYLGWKGIEGLARVSMVWLLWMVLPILTLPIMLYNMIDFTAIFPLFGPGPLVLVREGVSHSLYFGENMALLALAAFSRKPEDLRKGIVRGSIYSILLCSFMVLMVQLVMASPSTVAFPYLDMVRMIYINRFIHHLEGFYAAVWLLIAFTQIGIGLYVLTVLFANLFHMNEYRPLLIPMAGVLFLLSLMPRFFAESLIWKDLYLTEGGGLLGYGSFLLFYTLALFRRKRTATT